jgi:hypothetical protein
LLDATIDTLVQESNPAVVGPSDVASVYDVVALLSASAPRAELRLYDGSVLSATLRKHEPQPADGRARAASQARKQTPDGETRRVMVEGVGALQVGELELRSTSTRRIRWDVTLESGAFSESTSRARD